MNRNFLLGKFWNPDHVLEALEHLQDKGVKVYDVYAPFPIHGIEPLLDIKRTRLTVAAFIYGAFGLTLALTMMSLIYGVVWPVNIGGKPYIPWIAFTPITFETTVLFAAHGMVLTFFIIGPYWPGKKEVLMDDRQTDDVFVIAIDKKKISDMDGVKKTLSEAGAFEITEKEA
jgi:Protein of unknown function (DUF3341)